MKRMLFALLAILMLTACGKEEVPVPPPAETPQVSEVPVIQ